MYAPRPVPVPVRRPSQPGRIPPKKGCIDNIINPIIACFFLVNFIFWVSGIAALSLGAIAYFDEDTLDTLKGLDPSNTFDSFDVTGLVRTVALGFMIGGGLLMVIGFLGCCGVAVGNSYLIYSYAVLIILIVILELVALGFFFVNKDSLPTALKVELENALKDYDGVENSKLTRSKALDLAQQLFECCGLANGKDFTRSVWYNKTRKGAQVVPLSCCALKNIAAKDVPVKPKCQLEKISDNNPYTNSGCYKAIKDYIYQKGITAAIIIGILLAIQLIAICCASVVERSYRDLDLAYKLHQGRV